jgi:NADH-quinone oxidoreductase subunit F
MIKVHQITSQYKTSKCGFRMNFEQIVKKAKEKWAKIIDPNKLIINIGEATCGLAAGANFVNKVIQKELKMNRINGLIHSVGCIGACFAEPIIEIRKPNMPSIFYSNVTPDSAREIVQDYIINNNPRTDLAFGQQGDNPVKGIPILWELKFFKTQIRNILRNCGVINPEKIDEYIANGGYEGLRKAVNMKSQEIIELIKESGLRGRGGAGFPTGLKWQFGRNAKGTDKYIICNADEGDPGAFMNRSVLEGDPHSILEGLLIGAYAIGATKGYIYCRAEYPLALKRLKIALDQMRKYNLLGENILDYDFSFDIKIKEGAGAFVCGEETALIASIEGKRGMPTARPPFPTDKGLWGKPTVINNVETWVNIANILKNGVNWFRKHGTEKSKGTKTFCLVGKVKNTGIVEVPLGTTIREVVFNIGEGIRGNKKFKAVQTGGPSGGALPSEFLDNPIDYEELTKAGAIMGSGGMIVIDEETCIVDLAKYFLNFTQHESCGKCVMCREGTYQMLKLLEKITYGKGVPEDIDLLLEIGEIIKIGSLCGLGQTAPNPVLTTLKYFRGEYEKHINQKICQAKVCKDLILFQIDPKKCIGCGLCKRECPVEAIEGEAKLIHIIEHSKCIKCGKCYDVCPEKIKAVIKISGRKIKTPKHPIPVGNWRKSEIKINEGK